MLLRTLIILFLLSNVALISDAQEWFPQCATWYYNQVYIGGNSYQKFDVIGETLIKEKLCKVITGVCQSSTYDFFNSL